jgi:O-glycosyl hydrolase
MTRPLLGLLYRVVLGAVVLGVVLLAPGSTIARVDGPVGGFTETRFWTGCRPGPFHEPPWPDPILDHAPPPEPSQPLNVQVDLDSADARPPMLGAGFNLEHGLWSCPEFRNVFETEILQPFRPAVARVDSGMLPAAPVFLPTADLGPAVYRSVLSSPVYRDSWRFFDRLNQAGVRVLLGVWGGPDQFTDDGTRRGRLLPQHYDDYVRYVVSLVAFLTRHQDLDIWAVTIANEPDGGDGNQIPPDGLAYVAHQLAERLPAYGVRLYGPDTASADAALDYLPRLLGDPVVAGQLAAVGFHAYYPTPDVGATVEYVHRQRPDLPVIVTEYTSFAFGDLDDGQEIRDQLDFTIDIVDTVLSHYRYGVDAALYWDAVDYLQPGHDAITKWGLLRGPGMDFARRKHYYGLGQVLPYLQPGARVLDSRVEGDASVSILAVQTAAGEPAVFLVNQEEGDVPLTISLSGDRSAQVTSLVVTRTDIRTDADPLGRVRLTDGSGNLTLPARSVTTLVPPDAVTGVV